MNREPARSSFAAGEADEGIWVRLGHGRPPFLYLILFYAAYVLAGGFGQGLAIIPGVSITFWPPAGIFVATLLLTSRYSWPWWIAAGGLAELTCNAIWFHNAIPFALIYFSANALVALTAAWLITRFTGEPFRLESLEEVAAFVVLGAGIAPMVSATVIATTDALLGKHAFWTAWPLVWLGDGTGLLVSTPLTLVAVQTWRDRANIPLLRLTLQLHFSSTSESMGDHDSGGHGWREHRLRRRLSCGHRRCGR
jgi:integral membrane sensor domain MASE1